MPPGFPPLPPDIDPNPTAYNALDVAKAAQELLRQLVLEEQDLRGTLDYLWHALQADDTGREEAHLQKIVDLKAAIARYLTAE